jgi:hypothetical protein
MAQEQPPQGPGGEWLAAQAQQRPAAVTRAQQLIAAGWRSNDAALHARQYLEPALGARAEDMFGAADYRLAAERLAGAGRAAHGEVMDTIAGADGELLGARPSWQCRYEGRRPTAAERTAEELIRTRSVVERGKPGHGLDGAWYTPAWYPRSGKPAVVVTTSAMTEEVVPFASIGDARGWLASRAPGAAGPLMTTADGPVTRTVREEEVLAWLLRSPLDTAAMTGGLAPGAWTTHLRAELAAALRFASTTGGTPGYGVLAEAFGRRLLRAPGWAGQDIGWPAATRAMTYLQRLAATSVTREQAHHAASSLARTDTTAPGTAPAASVTREPALLAGAASPLPQRPPGLRPGPGGPVQAT